MKRLVMFVLCFSLAASVFAAQGEVKSKQAVAGERDSLELAFGSGIHRFGQLVRDYGVDFGPGWLLLIHRIPGADDGSAIGPRPVRETPRRIITSDDGSDAICDVRKPVCP